MKRILCLALMILPSIAFAGGVEFYWNGKLVSTFYSEKATGYSAALLTSSKQDDGRLLFDLEENYNRNSTGFDTKFDRQTIVGKTKEGAFYFSTATIGFSFGYIEFLTIIEYPPTKMTDGFYALWVNGSKLFAIRFTADLVTISEN